jgi:hypothetical protein
MTDQPRENITAEEDNFDTGWHEGYAQGIQTALKESAEKEQEFIGRTEYQHKVRKELEATVNRYREVLRSAQKGFAVILNKKYENGEKLKDPGSIASCAYGEIEEAMTDQPRENITAEEDNFDTGWHEGYAQGIQTALKESAEKDEKIKLLTEALEGREKEVIDLGMYVFRLVHVLRNGTVLMGPHSEMDVMTDRMEICADKASEYLKEHGLANPWKLNREALTSDVPTKPIKEGGK